MKTLSQLGKQSNTRSLTFSCGIGGIHTVIGFDKGNLHLKTHKMEATNRDLTQPAPVSKS